LQRTVPYIFETAFGPKYENDPARFKAMDVLWKLDEVPHPKIVARRAGKIVESLTLASMRQYWTHHGDLTDSEYVAWAHNALLTLPQETLAQHADGLAAIINDDDRVEHDICQEEESILAAAQLFKSMPAPVIAKHAETFFNILRDESKQGEQEGYILCTAIVVLKRMDSATLAPYLGELLTLRESPDEYLREAALTLLARIEPTLLSEQADAIVASFKNRHWSAKNIYLLCLKAMSKMAFIPENAAGLEILNISVACLLQIDPKEEERDAHEAAIVIVSKLTPASITASLGTIVPLLKIRTYDRTAGVREGEPLSGPFEVGNHRWVDLIVPTPWPNAKILMAVLDALSKIAPESLFPHADALESLVWYDFPANTEEETPIYKSRDFKCYALCTHQGFSGEDTSSDDEDSEEPPSYEDVRMRAKALLEALYEPGAPGFTAARLDFKAAHAAQLDINEL